jgi:hypothetical protein
MKTSFVEFRCNYARAWFLLDCVTRFRARSARSSLVTVLLV